MKVKDLAVLIQGKVDGDGDADITRVSGLEEAGSGDLVFAVDEERLTIAERTEASCVLTTQNIRKSSKPLVRVNNPKMAFLLIYNALNKPTARKTFTHPSAIVAPSAKIGRNVWIDSGVRIADNVKVGDNTIIESNTVIKEDCSIGLFCHLHPNVTLYEKTVLKDRVVLHSGVVLGADGFGYVREKDKLYKFPQLGGVTIEDDVEIGANSAVDRGSLSDTIIGAGTKIDNLCQIAHNVKIGKNVVMAGQSGVSGSVTIGDNVTIAGQVGIKDNIKIGNNVIIAAQSGITDNLPENLVVWGTPSRPITAMKRQVLAVRWLADNFARIKKMVEGRPWPNG